MSETAQRIAALEQAMNMKPLKPLKPIDPRDPWGGWRRPDQADVIVVSQGDFMARVAAWCKLADERLAKLERMSGHPDPDDVRLAYNRELAGLGELELFT